MDLSDNLAHRLRHVLRGRDLADDRSWLLVRAGNHGSRATELRAELGELDGGDGGASSLDDMALLNALLLALVFTDLVLDDLIDRLTNFLRLVALFLAPDLLAASRNRGTFLRRDLLLFDGACLNAMRLAEGLALLERALLGRWDLLHDCAALREREATRCGFLETDLCRHFGGGGQGEQGQGGKEEELHGWEMGLLRVLWFS